MTTEAEILQKSGANVSASFDTTMMTAAAVRAEGTVNVLCRYNWNDVYSGLDTDVRGILSDIVSSLVAMEAIAYDMSGYTSRIEAEDMINVLRDGALRGLSIIRDKKNQTFIDNPSAGSV